MGMTKKELYKSDSDSENDELWKNIDLNDLGLTKQELQEIDMLYEGLWEDMNSNKPDSEKKYLNELYAVVKRNDLKCCNCGYNNLYKNYYGSNNVHIIDNNGSSNSNGGKVGCLF